MGARGLTNQQVVIPFGVGLNQKMDSRAMQVPSLTRCLDAAFTEAGGLQTRYPYASIGANIFGGGTVSDCRRVFECGSELLLFTATALYSWNAQNSVWVSKGTHLAVKVDESVKFVSTGDQIECDRAELNGTVVYTWNDTTTVSAGYVAAVDQTTGSVLMAPTAVASSESRLRVVALSTKFLLFGVETTNFNVRVLDPASPAAGVAAAATLINALSGLYYDVVKVPSSDSAVFASRYDTTTSYLVGTVTSAGVVASTLKVRTCDGPIAVSCEPTGTQVQIIRGNSTNVQGDLLTIATLADVYTAQAVGTAGAAAITQIAAAHRSTQDSSVYRCYAFWCGADNAAGYPTWGTKSNWVSTGNTLGTQALFGCSTVDDQLGVASRAFDYGGRIYLWMEFSGLSSAGTSPTQIALQNTHFLLRDDGFVCAKAAAGTAGGTHGAVGHLPGVGLVSGSTSFAWCSSRRQIVPLGGDSEGYSARDPSDITFTFDSNEARRCVRLGETMYISGGEILTYDGQRIVECGFHVFPYYMTLAVDAGTGNVADGAYTYKESFRWENARGDVDRSASGSLVSSTMAAGPGHFSLVTLPVTATHKHITGNLPAKEIWRTAVSPSDDSPFYLVTSKDPSVTGTNGYLDSTEFTFDDAFVDSVATTKETHPENGGLLENLAPPAATVIHATADRLFLAGVSGDPHRVWYSKQRQANEIAAFHEALTVPVPRAGGDITAIAVRDGVLYVWRETACYALPGDGFDNFGGGQNFGPARLISGDVGCVSMEALAATSTGYVFKSSKGWYALQGLQVEYIGDKVSDYDSDTVYAVHVLEGQHQIRILTSARMLVFDTNVQQWAEWTVSDGLHACMWNGTYHYLATAAVKAEQTTYTSLDYGMDVETAWIPLGTIQGFGRIWGVHVLGEYRSTHRLRVRLYRNWTATAFQDKYWTVSPTTVGDALEVDHRPSIQEMRALKIRLTANHPSSDATPPTGEALKLSHLTLELGLERYLARLPSAQTQ
jgi:hypothetical protein